MADDIRKDKKQKTREPGANETTPPNETARIDSDPQHEEQIAPMGSTASPSTSKSAGARAAEPEVEPEPLQSARVYVRAYGHADVQAVGPYVDGATLLQGVRIRVGDIEHTTDKHGECIVSVAAGRTRVRPLDHPEYGRIGGAYYETAGGEYEQLEMDDSGACDIDVDAAVPTRLDLWCTHSVQEEDKQLYAKACGAGGSLIDAITRLLRDEHLTRRVAQFLEQASDNVGKAPADIKRARAKGLSDLFDHSLGAFAGKATKKADSPVCGGRLTVQFRGKCDPAFAAGVTVNLSRGESDNASFYSAKLMSGSSQVEFCDLPSSTYLGWVVLGEDLSLEKEYEITVGTEECVRQIENNRFQAEVKAPGDTVIELSLQYRSRTLEVIVFEDVNGTGEYKGQPRIEGASVEVSLRGKVIACQNTDTFGCRRFDLDEPGSYMIHARPWIRVNGCAYRQVREGGIYIYAAPGERCPIVVPFGYRRAGASLSLSLQLAQGNATELASASIEYGLFDTTRMMVQSGVITGNDSVSVMDLKDDVYELILKSDQYEVVTPGQGYCRVKASAGQFHDLTGGIIVEKRADDPNTTRIYGELRNGDTVLAGQYLELLCRATGRTLARSFADDNGLYSIFTDRRLSEVALRLEGFSQLIPVDQKPQRPAPGASKDTAFAAQTEFLNAPNRISPMAPQGCAGGRG